MQQSKETQNQPHFWCFVCENSFKIEPQPSNRRKRPPTCLQCNSDAVQEISKQSRPDLFQVFEVQPNVPQNLQNLPRINLTANQSQTQTSRNADIRSLPLLSSLLNRPLSIQNLHNFQVTVVQTGGNLQPSVFSINNSSSPESYQSFQQRLNNIFSNLFGSNHSVTSPATQEQIERLKKIKTEDIGECSICQNVDCEKQQEQKEQLGGIQLTCKHMFHQDCILQWLKRSNTCPTCRHSL